MTQPGSRRERGDRGGRPIQPHGQSPVGELVDSLPLPAAVITGFEGGQWTVLANDVLLSVFRSPPALAGSIGLGEVLDRRDRLPSRFDAALAEVWRSGRAHHDRLDAPGWHIALWASRIGRPDPL